MYKKYTRVNCPMQHTHIHSINSSFFYINTTHIKAGVGTAKMQQIASFNLFNCPHYFLISTNSVHYNHYLLIVIHVIPFVHSVNHQFFQPQSFFRQKLTCILLQRGLCLLLPHSTILTHPIISSRSMSTSQLNCQFCCPISLPGRHPPMPLSAYPNTSSFTFSLHQLPSQFHF